MVLYVFMYGIYVWYDEQLFDVFILPAVQCPMADW